jgi:hypothetical protein
VSAAEAADAEEDKLYGGDKTGDQMPDYVLRLAFRFGGGLRHPVRLGLAWLGLADLLGAPLLVGDLGGKTTRGAPRPASRAFLRAGCQVPDRTSPICRAGP